MPALRYEEHRIVCKLVQVLSKQVLSTELLFPLQAGDCNVKQSMAPSARCYLTASGTHPTEHNTLSRVTGTMHQRRTSDTVLTAYLPSDFPRS